jgi:penicillin-binding protein 2A
MRKNGVITESEYVAALQKELPNEPYVSKQNDGYLQGVFDELTDISERFTLSLSGDVRIYTYLQQNVQQKAETLAAGHVDTDKAFIVLSPKTGGIKAYVSTAYNARRLPGSLLKPLLVYAPCIEENILSPATPILDEKINYGGYSPKNYDDTFHGYVSAKESLAKSYNVPAVKCLETLGLDKGERYLQKMRLSIDETDKMTKKYQPLESVNEN